MGARARALAATFLVGIAAVAGEGVALAEQPPACRPTSTGPPPPEYFEYAPLLTGNPGPIDDARAWLGEQFGGAWLQGPARGWYIGVAPGPIDLATARAYVLTRIDAHFAGSDAEVLRERLHVTAQPYGIPELRAIQAELGDALARADWGIGWTLGVGCRHSDAFRVELELYNDSTAAHLAAARELAAPWGDRVVVVRLPVGPPRPALPSRPRVMKLVALSGCARKSRLRLRVRRATRPQVRRVRVAVGGRRATAQGKRLRRPLRIALPGGKRPLRARISVWLRSGVLVSANRRVPRCGRRASP